MPSLLNFRRPRREVAPRIAAADLGGGDAELVLYGDVVEEESRDLWTGERDGRPCVSAEGFNERFPELAGAEHITVRLNSCGGDVFTGIAICNALKALPAKVTVRIDGIAASAASVIACAGDEVVAMPGSIFMIHEAAAGLLGYYQRADLEALLADLDANNRAILNVYAEKTGRDAGDIAQLMAEETWLVGREIVDAGFADVYEGETEEESDHEAEVEDEGDGEMVIAGVRHDMTRFRHVPDLAARIALSEKQPIKETPADAPAVVDKQEPPQAAGNEGGTFMNVTELREQHPDLAAEIAAEAARAERERIAEIDEIAAGIAPEMVREAKYGENPLTAQELAFNAMKADRAAAVRYLAEVEQDAEESGADEVGTDPAPADEPSEEEAAEAEAKKQVECAAALFQTMKGGRR